ncbi:MAG: tetratricopeptide repeat protein [Verrucomicrobiales bacterium]|nr:tetratricopeptide repeat protein [Verrucomicrobiales bacterium]
MPVLPHRICLPAGLLFCCLFFALPVQTGVAQVTLPGEGTLTAEELIAKANAAFASGDFEAAEAFFLAFERDYGEEEEVRDILEKNNALIALCKITNGRAAEAGPYIEKALQDPELPRDIREELTFWDAIQKLQAGAYRDAQEVLGGFFQQTDFTFARRLEALTLFGTCYMLEGYHKTAAEFFAHQIPNLRKVKAGESYASRAVVLEMMAKLESEQFAEALELLKREYPNLGQITQVVSFQTLALQLGSHFMDNGDYYSAIACLQRIWPKARLLKHQNEKLASLIEIRDSLEGDLKRQSALFQIEGTIKRVQRELENFEKIENFDAALRLRLAMAFQSLERYREAALIMEDMLQRMETSPVVESASLAVIQCWSQLERWPRALQASENYLQAFGDEVGNRNLPRVLFMQADAMMQLQMNGDAESVFHHIAKTFPDHTLASKAIFMKGFCQLQQDKNEEAVQTFDEVLAVDPKSSIGQDAFYWKANAMSFAQRYEEAFQLMDEYLENYQGAGIKYESEAVFRKAYCTFCLADYPAAISELRQFLVDYGPGAKDRDEAQLLLGDALLGEGEADAGIAAYEAINPASTRFYEDGYFKIGKAYKLLEEIPTMRQHYQTFLQEYPESKRMPEAVYWIGWTYVHSDQLEKAKKVYWDTINQHGNDPALFAIEELLMALPKVYKRQGPDGVGELTRSLQSLYIQADREKKSTLAVRALWADAMLKEQRDKINEASAILVRLATLIDPEIHNPQIVADAADALTEKGDLERAEKLYKDLRKWNPVSFHKARSYKGLGIIAEKQGETKEAIRYYRQYEKEAASSTDLADVVLKRIKLELESGGRESLQQDLEGLLENPVASTKHKAEALFLIGEMLAQEGEYEKATAYYERVYVVYGKYRALVAKSYFRRGGLLEKLGNQTGAYEVYAELANREDLKEFRESTLGRRKADELKEFAPQIEESETGKETP